jgi:predicted glycoside hydrolase/deacetylase ChbG (UPF0249 family)
MSAKRCVIVNADDFGQSPGVNRGIIAAHEQGVVTSTSLMVRWPAAEEAAAYARAHPRLAVGLHLDLGEWVCRDGTWEPLYEVVRQDDAAAVAGEVSRQLAAFRRLVGRDPTHLDSHQHAHQKEPVKGLMIELAGRLGVPLRGCDPTIRYFGGFYGQTDDGRPLPEVLTPEGLIRILAELPPGVTELGCHPGEGEDLDTMYSRERALEVGVLCDPSVREALTALGIELCSFHRSSLPA